MPNAQVAIVTLDQSAEDEVGGGFWRGTRALNPALLTLTDGAADSQSWAETGLRILALDRRRDIKGA